MQLPITLLYAGLLAIFALILGFRAGSLRGKTGISLLYGDPVNWDLAEKVRGHQNFLEYVPMILILMAAIELSGGSGTFLHLAGGLLVVSRVFHAAGLKHDNIRHLGRAIGAGGSALITLATAGYALWLAAGGLLK